LFIDEEQKTQRPKKKLQSESINQRRADNTMAQKKVQSESINQRRADNTMAKKKVQSESINQRRADNTMAFFYTVELMHSDA
jgi:hypothetical protein